MPPFALSLREPVSSLSHALGLAAALPITWLLVRAAMRQPAPDRASLAFRRGKAASLAVFGFGMAACYAASAAYHGLNVDGEGVERLRRLDMVGIFLLIAGTFTPAAWALMTPAPRRAAIGVVWGVSATCAAVIASGRPFPTWLATIVYITLGWGMIGCYLDVRRTRDPRTLRLLPLGGALYTAGAVLNLSGLPEILPGVGPHEVFHAFVLGGTAAHVAFLFRTAVPAPPPGLPVDHRPQSTRPASVRRARETLAP